MVENSAIEIRNVASNPLMFNYLKRNSAKLSKWAILIQNFWIKILDRGQLKFELKS